MMQTGRVGGAFKAVTRPSGKQGQRGQQAMSMQRETRCQNDVSSMDPAYGFQSESNAISVVMQCHGTRSTMH